MKRLMTATAALVAALAYLLVVPTGPANAAWCTTSCAHIYHRSDAGIDTHFRLRCNPFDSSTGYYVEEGHDSREKCSSASQLIYVYSGTNIACVYSDGTHVVYGDTGWYGMNKYFNDGYGCVTTGD